MTDITLKIPTTQSEIPQILQQLKDQLAEVQVHMNAIQGAIKAVQTMCKHSTMSHGRDYDGGSWSKCTICGYST